MEAPKNKLLKKQKKGGCNVYAEAQLGWIIDDDITIIAEMTHFFNSIEREMWKIVLGNLKNSLWKSSKLFFKRKNSFLKKINLKKKGVTVARLSWTRSMRWLSAVGGNAIWIALGVGARGGETKDGARVCQCIHLALRCCREHTHYSFFLLKERKWMRSHGRVIYGTWEIASDIIIIESRRANFFIL